MPSEDQTLQHVLKELTTIRQLVSKAVNAIADAESEVPEKMRRFVMYMHDVHDIVNMYREFGHEAPDYVKQEMERCDDRFRQLLTEMHTDGGAFEKVRREMAKDPLNRWDHTRLLSKPNGVKDETRTSNNEQDGIDEDRAGEPSGEPRRRV